ncbi:MAG: TolC family protein, partial [Sulfuriferula sp.]
MKSNIIQINPQREHALLFVLCASLTLPWVTLAQAVTTDSQSAHGVESTHSRYIAETGKSQDETEREPLTAKQLVQTVLQHNQSIDSMRAAADASSARIESAGALDDPMVSYAVAPNTAGGPRQGLNQNLQISQKFPWPGTLDLRSKMASAEAESADQQVADLRLRLVARARADYAQWYYVHRALAVNAENRNLVMRLRAVAESAYASGQSPQQDVLQ